MPSLGLALGLPSRWMARPRGPVINDAFWDSVTSFQAFRDNFQNAKPGASWVGFGGAAINNTRQLFSRNTLTLGGVAADYLEASGGAVPAEWQITDLTTFCLDGWVFTTGTAQQAIVGNLNDDTGARHFYFFLNALSSQVLFGTAGANYGFAAGSFPTNAWTYVRIAVGGGNVACFTGTTPGGAETQLGTTQAFTASTGANTGIALRIGRSSVGANAYPLAGSLANLRLTKGQSRGMTAGTVPGEVLT